MTRDFLVGARPLHDGEMLRLGLRQLAESEVLLRKLLAAYERAKTQELAQEIARECSFISQTLDALTDMATSQPGPNFTVSGALLRVSQHLRRLILEAEQALRGQDGGHGDAART